MKLLKLLLVVSFFGLSVLQGQILEDAIHKILFKIQSENLQKLNQNHYFYQNLIFKTYNVMYLVDFKSSKTTISADFEYSYQENLKFSVFFGNSFLKKLWNQTVFLKETISSELDTQYSRRKLKGIYPMIEKRNVFYGFFYLEDFSKGLFWGFKDNLFLWDFYYKKWLVYFKRKIERHSFFINWAGEKKENQGYIFYSSLSNDYCIQFFGMRNSLWDYYQYYEDSYDQKNKSNLFKSFLGSISLNFMDLYFYSGFYKKGNVNFIKAESDYKIFYLEGFSIVIGIDFYKQEFTNNKRESYNLNIKNTLMSQSFLYSFEYRIFEDFYNFMYKISYKKYKNYFTFGILYQNLDLEKILNSIEVLRFSFVEDSELDFLFQREFWFDRSYISAILEGKFYFEKISFLLKYFYIKKFLSKSNLKESHSLEINFVFEF